jgi:hypothetical protein
MTARQKQASRKKKSAKLARKRRIPTHERTDWGNMKVEVSSLITRLREQPSTKIGIGKNSTILRDILTVYCWGEISANDVETILRERFFRPTPVAERTDWDILENEAGERICRLRQKPPNLKCDDRCLNSPSSIMEALLAGDVDESKAQWFLNNWAGRPISSRDDINQIESDIVSLLARLQELREQTIPRMELITAGRILLAYREGYISDAEAAVRINNLIESAHDQGI